MPSDLCAWHQMGSFSPGRLNTGRLPQPDDAHCRLRACSGKTPAQVSATLMGATLKGLKPCTLRKPDTPCMGKLTATIAALWLRLGQREGAHLHHALLPVGAAKGGVLVAHVLEGGVRGAVGECAEPVAVVHHAIRLVRGAPCCGLPCSSIGACSVFQCQVTLESAHVAFSEGWP